MNVPYLRQLAFERFINLLLTKHPKDQRTTEQLRQIAARQVVQEARREARINGKSQAGAHSQNTTTSPLDTLLNRIWRIVSNQRTYAELMQRRNLDKVSKSKITPTIIDAPIVCDEPAPVQVRRTADSKDNVITFPVVSGIGSSAKALDDEPDLFIPRFIDPVTTAWRQSISENQKRAEEKRIRSLAYQAAAKSKWIG
jgi:hypothetical protein